MRNGRIGQLKTVEVGLPGDPSGDVEPEMPVPKTLQLRHVARLDAARVYYTEKRVHPQVGYDRPGWLRCEQFGAGMITGWGAHHVDTAHWGMGTEHTGPVEIWGTARVPDQRPLGRARRLPHRGAATPTACTMIISGDFPNGIKFIGTEGWIFVSRGNETVTGSDPVAKLADATALAASDPKHHQVGHRARANPPPREHGPSRQLARVHPHAPPPIAPVEVAHRSCSACLLHHMAMKREPHACTGIPSRERFKNDDEANALLSRPQRAPYQVD